MMTTEIKRNTWSRFCRKFSENNQYRETSVVVSGNRKKRIPVAECIPFVGLALEKKGRLIDGIGLYGFSRDGESHAEPIITVKQPSQVILEKNREGQDSRLHIVARDGTEAMVELLGRRDDQDREHFAREIAYALFERRGYDHGRHLDDWYEAQQRLAELRERFTI
jgi:hypothetical protein